jgi:hypothetical protein
MQCGSMYDTQNVSHRGLFELLPYAFCLMDSFLFQTASDIIVCDGQTILLVFFNDMMWLKGKKPSTMLYC